VEPVLPATPSEVAPEPAARDEERAASATGSLTQPEQPTTETRDASTPRRSARAAKASAKSDEKASAQKAEAEKAPVSKRKPDCANPFIIDARGIRRVKRECLD
jgi:hypothetical protein